MAKPHTWHVQQAKDGEWYFEEKAGNNQVLVTSETYTRREDAVRAAEQHSDGRGDILIANREES